MFSVWGRAGPGRGQGWFWVGVGSGEDSAGPGRCPSAEMLTRSDYSEQRGAVLSWRTARCCGVTLSGLCCRAVVPDADVLTSHSCSPSAASGLPALKPSLSRTAAAAPPQLGPAAGGWGRC